MGHIGLVKPEEFDELIAPYEIIKRGYLCNKLVYTDFDKFVTLTPASHWYVVIASPQKESSNG